MTTNTNNVEKMLMSSKDLQKECGFSRTMSYMLLNRSDLPVVRIGERRFMLREKFLEWLEQQASNGAEA